MVTWLLNNAHLTEVTQFFAEIHFDPACLAGYEKIYCLVSGGMYVLSVRDNARLQGFPDDFVFYESMSAAYTHVGNAVCPPVARRVAEANL